jgi:hypothetical protein
MRPNLPLRKSAAAALAGAAMLPAAAPSHAVVVYGAVVSLAVPVSTKGLYLNVVTGANNLPTSTGGSTVPGWDINIYSTNGLGFFNPSTPAGGAYVVSSGPTIANLTAGTSIGGGSSFSSAGASNVSQSNLNSSTNIFGFRFTNEADGVTDDGWGRISLLAAPNTAGRTLVEYACVNVAGAPILAGAVPEPGTGRHAQGCGLQAASLRRHRRLQPARRHALRR